MITMLMGWGLGARAAKLIAYVGVPLMILAVIAGGIWLIRHDAYKDGRRDEQAAWQEAERRLHERERQSAARATVAADKREAEHAAKVEAEKEKIDEALAEGRSPFDVLFGADGR